ncbi:MAG: FapA family protein [Oscillospiraceae bacterium]|jgi:uncharacterized protein (DUF342 family)|nr:FapA family protein [Oscillospiraceae bacterium]
MSKKAKYFAANSKEEAEALALSYFDCGVEDLTIDIIIEGKENESPWQILAIYGKPLEIIHMGAFFTLYYEESGVYLEIYEHRGRGAPLISDDLAFYLGRKEIFDLSVSAVQALVGKGSGRIKIARQQEERIFGEDLSIVVSGDEKEANAKLLAPEPDGLILDLDTAKRKLSQAGIVHGVDVEALSDMLSAKVYGASRVVARGTPPVDGEDGRLLFHFSTDERTGAPKEIGAGRVDYRSLDLFVPVVENQLLVSKTNATEGQPGVSVKGNIIKQRPGKEMMLPRGKNVIVSNNGTEMYSTCSGMVEYVNNAINVSNVYKINGDCDLSVGNIDFEGSVLITGSVRSGNTVKATDGINVGGGVEGAKLIAGGNIEVKGGMQGSGRGVIEAGGSVSIMFIEQGTIMADGPVTIDVSIHSRIETGSTIHALGRRGAIIGGSAAAAGDIVANFVGSLSNARTDIEVGVMPRKRARIEAIEKELEQLYNNKMKLDQLEAYLAKTKGAMDNETWTKLHLSGIENRKINVQDTQSFTAEMATLKEELEHATESRVHVFETAFSGSRVVIGSNVFIVNNEVSHATFRYSDGEVVFGPCELSKGDFK